MQIQVNLKSRHFLKMDISEVSKRSGLPASTLRYYEERGLIASVGRQGLRRRFDSGVLEQLALVSLGQAAGFSLEEISQMFSAERQPNIDRTMLATKAEQLDSMIRRLRAMRDGLRHAVECPAPSHMQCPSFQRLLKAAADGTLGPQTLRQRKVPAAKAVSGPETSGSAQGDR